MVLAVFDLGDDEGLDRAARCLVDIARCSILEA